MIPSKLIEEVIATGGHLPYKVKEMYGLNKTKDGKESIFNYTRWLPLVCCPYSISNRCCDVMKKAPIHSYEKRTGRKGITGQMAGESTLRAQKWMKNGCNAFHLKHPISNPMSFWTEQDVMKYIVLRNVPIASVYGEVVPDYEAMDMLPGQYTLSDIYDDKSLTGFSEKIYKTTGVKRTGCMFCGFGVHLDPSPNRFEQMKETHPKIYDYVMRPTEEGGLNFKEVIDWLNENADTNIKY